ncbi:MAG: Hsp33 family molecular chaperone HslO [Firmicutes bacterium]|nr:Hsp33 family molecular chaperone HslO [Bacillota bacterium]
MQDYMIRATAADGQIAAYAAVTTQTVEEARRRHGTSPVITAALGRTMTAAALMGWQLKDENESITIQIDGNGPVERIVAVSNCNGEVKGYVHHPDVDLPLNDKGKLDVGGAVGLGVMSIIKDIGLKEPYIGRTHLVSSEIAEDLAYYFTTSEQVPSAVALGVLVRKDQTVWTAGGFILQMMPGASDETAEALQEIVSNFMPVTEYFAMEHTPEELLDVLLSDFGYHILDKKEICFHCDCNKDRVSRALLSVGEAELQQMIDEGETIEMSCHYCGDKYYFTVEEMKALLAQGKKDQD